MKKILLCTYPPITSYPAIANVLSILWAKKEEAVPWICDHFIQLLATEYDSRKYPTQGNFYDFSIASGLPLAMTTPFLNVSRLERKAIYLNNSKFSDYVEYMINNNVYLHLCLNQYYLSVSGEFKRNHRMHPTFIYGYDKENNEIYVGDFYIGGKYTQSKISYEELNNSYHLDCITENDPPWIRRITLYEYTVYNYFLNIDLIRNSYLDYLNEEDSFKKFKYDYEHGKISYVYGTKFYDVLAKSVENDRIDTRAFHVLYDHKLVSKIRIEYLFQHGYLNNTAYNELIGMISKLTDDTLILRNKVIKYSFNKKQKEKLSIIDKCNIIKMKDRKSVQLLLNAL